MKLLLAFPGNVLLPVGGGAVATLGMMKALASLGHECRIVDGGTDESRRRAFIAAIGASDGSAPLSPRPQRVAHSGIRIERCEDGALFCAQLLAEIREFQPDWVVVTQDRTFNTVRLALEAAPDRVVLIAHAAQMLPLGPGSWVGRDPAKVELLRRARGIITVSRAMRDYIQTWGGVQAQVLKFPSYARGPHPDLARPADGLVLMVNPCAIKGLPIFLQLADAFPTLTFGAVPTWGTTQTDLAALQQRPNVTLVEPDPDVTKVLTSARVVLVPSLYNEAFGQIAVDAMLCGLPVLASNVGGLPEAKLGVDYVLPVNPIFDYTEAANASLATMPAPIVPPQEIGAWKDALGEVTGSEARYLSLSRQSREAAHAFLASIDARDFERYFMGL